VGGAVRERSRRAVLLLAVGLLVACAPSSQDGPDPIRIATAPDAESRLLAATVARLVEGGGFSVQLVAFADDRSGRQALELGDVDVHVAYTGQVWLERLGRANPPGDPTEAIESVARADLESGVVWMVVPSSDGIESPPVNATFAFFVAGPPAADADLRTLSELSLRLSERPELSICVDTEFGRRPDGLAALLSAYSVRRDRPFLAADPAEAVLGVLAGECIAGLSHATDGVAWRAGLRPLVDDLRFFPAFIPLPTVRAETLAAREGLAAALEPFGAGLSTGMLGRANGRIAAGQPVEAVARELADRLIERSGAAPAMR